MQNSPDHYQTSQDISGFCARCQAIHTLPSGNAHVEAKRLMEQFEQNGSIALQPEFIDLQEISTGPLFGEQRGKMFGVLECLDRVERLVWLYAFSGQFGGRWRIPGWAPPLFDVDQFHRINEPVEKRIKALTRQIEQEADTPLAKQLKSERNMLCRQLMKDIHALYLLRNFRGETATLDEVIGSNRNKPTGIGDCCAPKLLNSAALQGLKPLSMSEFYFGQPNRSSSKHHKQLYPPCSDKCGPLLGFLLCGM